MLHQQRIIRNEVRKRYGSFRLHFNFFYIFIFIIWSVLQQNILHVDAAGRTITLLTIVGLLINLSLIFNIFFSRQHTACIIWGILTVYSMFNALYHGVNHEDGAINFCLYNFIQPIGFVSILFICLREDYKLTLKYLFAALLTYVCLGATKIEESTQAEGRFLNASLGNALPLHAVSLSFVATIMLLEKILKRNYFILIIIGCFAIIMLAATRKALGALIIILIGLAFTQRKKITYKSIFKFALLVIVLYWGYEYTLDNTFIGERIQQTMSNEDLIPLVSNPYINKFLNSLFGDRAIQYLNGTTIFLEHPLTGIGLDNYRFVAHEEYVLHTEYIVQLCENGLIGFTLFMMFIITIFKNFHSRKLNAPINHSVLFAGFLAILLINFTAWTYNLTSILMMYTLIFNYIYSQILQKDEINSNRTQR